MVTFTAPSNDQEAAFGASVEELTQALWDLGGETKKGFINLKFEAVMRARNELVRSLGCDAAPGLDGLPRQKPPSASSWKCALEETVAREKGPAQLSYVTLPASPGTPPDQGPFLSRVSCTEFRAVYTGEAADTKRRAEHSAAQRAMAAEFPELFRASLQLLGPCPSAPSTSFGGPVGVKRKAPDFASPPAAPGILASKVKVPDDGPRARVQDAAQLLCQRTLTKGDVVLDTQQVPGSELFVASVTVVSYDPNESYFGEPCASKKAAENSACQSFLGRPEIVSEVSRLAELMKEKKRQKTRSRPNRKEHEGLLHT